MSRLTSAGFVAAAALAVAPHFAAAQTMSAEEIVRRLQMQREALAAEPKEEAQTRTLRIAPASKPETAADPGAATISTAPAAPAAPETASTSPSIATGTNPTRTQEPVLTPAAATDALPVMKDEMAIDLVVFFEFDSAILRPDARAELDNLCKALTDPRMSGSFEIIGHTDAAGSDSYNLALSKARAEEVVRHLSRSCGIEESRLEAHGLGEKRLKDAGDPRSSVNRRVEIQVGS